MSTYCQTDVGKERNRNEDSVYCTTVAETEYELIAVADGMGGHPDGDLASELATEVMASTISSAKNLDLAPEDHLKSAYHDAHEAIVKRTSDGAGEPGTTLVAALVDGERAIIANVGDSRAYCIDEHLEQITTDQSQVQKLVEAGELEPEEANDHPMSHVLDQALGTTDDLTVDVDEIPLDDEWLLLCSDGLTDPVSEETIERTCRESGTIEDAGSTLIQYALNAGGPDNVSVALYSPD